MECSIGQACVPGEAVSATSPFLWPWPAVPPGAQCALLPPSQVPCLALSGSQSPPTCHLPSGALPGVCGPSTLTPALHTHSRVGNLSTGTGGFLSVGIYLAVLSVLRRLAHECVLLECGRALVGTQLVSQCPVSLGASAASRVPETGLHLSSACSSHSTFLRGI